MSNTAWIALLELLDCAMKSARGLPEKDKDGVSNWLGIEFRIADTSMIVPINEVNEVLPVPRCTQIPGAKSYVKGLANVRGRLVPVIDLNRFFGRPSKAVFKDRRAFIVETEEFVTGLIVDEVVGMRHFDEEKYLPEVPVEHADFAPFMRGMFADDGKGWSIFSPRFLTRDERFTQVAI